MADYFPTNTGGIPTGLRYKPLWTYKLLYEPETFACCDYTANNNGNKIAFAFTDRDYGVIELGRLYPNVEFRGDKRFYIDFKTWKDPDGGPIKAVDMSFGYDYQRLYTLYKQSLNDGTYKLWLTRYETGNYKDGSRITPPVSVPLYTFVHSSRLRGHPAVPTRTYPHDYKHTAENVPQDGWDDLYKYQLGIAPRTEAVQEDVFCSVLEYLEAYGITGVCLDRPALEPFFNCLVSHDKVFITMPVFFKPDKVKLSWLTDPEKLKIYWTPDHPRAIYQLLIMLDETTSRIEACAVVGAFSWWVEGKNTPWPDITPQMPLKARMTQIDDCVVWQCAHERTFPASMTNEAWYEHLIKAYKEDEGDVALPITDYDPNAWVHSKLPERFWQPYQTEYVKIPDLIEDLLAMNTTVLRPLQYRVVQAYVWTPVVSDLYKKALVDWSGRRVYGLRGKEFIEYEILYHNFKRKIFTGEAYVDHHLGEFQYLCAGDFVVDGQTRWHMFAIENLSCNTWMMDVELISSNAHVRFGTDPTVKPEHAIMRWDEIPPLNEVRFCVYSDTEVLDGVELQYALEIH